VCATHRPQRRTRERAVDVDTITGVTHSGGGGGDGGVVVA
jgi:hypothetical protein